MLLEYGDGGEAWDPPRDPPTPSSVLQATHVQLLRLLFLPSPFLLTK
jgi:hypothetical protein